MAHCTCTCNDQFWHFVLVTLLPTSRLWFSKKFSSRSQSKTSCLPLVYQNMGNYAPRTDICYVLIVRTFKYRCIKHLYNFTKVASTKWNFQILLEIQKRINSLQHPSETLSEQLSPKLLNVFLMNAIYRIKKQFFPKSWNRNTIACTKIVTAWDFKGLENLLIFCTVTS